MIIKCVRCRVMKNQNKEFTRNNKNEFKKTCEACLEKVCMKRYDIIMNEKKINHYLLTMKNKHNEIN